ncbi:MAG: FAD-dependent oxidoreductase [Candidatus Aenigmarchaeota archaeon]|nr:FAD-dependent oxidoreductase [Candidatus Aenigmarchaeota archaeon]
MAKQKNKNEPFDIIIIGAGVAGLAAAMYAGRMNLKTLVLGESPVGGVITTTDMVENYPGFKKITGLDLANAIKDHALEYKIKLEEDKVTEVKRIGSCFTLKTEEGKTYQSKTLLFATGTRHRELGVPGEKDLANRGVHRCALCDGAFYKNKVVAVIGGSDSAAKEALVLTQWAKKVYIIYRGEKIRAEPVNQKRIEDKIKQKKIEIIYSTNVKEIKGDNKVTAVILDKPYAGKKEFLLDAVFIEIGFVPLSDLAKNVGVAINDKGEIIINRNAETNVPGVYAAGDVADTAFKQAITGVGEAVLAVYSAYKYLGENNG